ncbi:hypothetical protein Ssi03_06030 [Sphaerisporangium siamense]|uniref:Secreted protein n=1 Tax=Sphaerisporangium siamense TaxID=795645 RepID=A0A7W7DDU0_9ACTN|nr:hypothetical protein [Sphaerisporangium siamense]MBB4704135.1 hypothetical protein [Sphaerisporangium siamense]GII82613.1 hypothetical protein Ssi03_06030 [Sphaerisporangium siamense]
MRRTLTTLSVLLAAAPLPLMALCPASAAGWGNGDADGDIVVETSSLPRTRFSHPAPGCYSLPKFPLLSTVTVTNGSNTDVIIYSGEQCKPGFLRPATRVRAGTSSRHTLTGAYSLMVDNP